jgi:hypothetical protein
MSPFVDQIDLVLRQILDPYSSPTPDEQRYLDDVNKKGLLLYPRLPFSQIPPRSRIPLEALPTATTSAPSLFLTSPQAPVKFHAIPTPAIVKQTIRQKHDTDALFLRFIRDSGLSYNEHSTPADLWSGFQQISECYTKICAQLSPFCAFDNRTLGIVLSYTADLDEGFRLVALRCLRNVCHRWRMVVDFTPKLWTLVAFDVDMLSSDKHTRIELARHMFLSGDLPLKIALRSSKKTAMTWEEIAPWFKVLYSQNTRFQDVTLPFNRIVNAVAKQGAIRDCQNSKLQQLVKVNLQFIQGLDIPEFQPQNFYASTLQELRLTNVGLIRPDFYSELVAATPNLTFLTLEGVIWPYETPRSNQLGHNSLSRTHFACEMISDSHSRGDSKFLQDIFHRIHGLSHTLSTVTLINTGSTRHSIWYSECYPIAPPESPTWRIPSVTSLTLVDYWWKVLRTNQTELQEFLTAFPGVRDLSLKLVNGRLGSPPHSDDTGMIVTTVKMTHRTLRKLKTLQIYGIPLDQQRYIEDVQATIVGSGLCSELKDILLENGRAEFFADPVAGNSQWTSLSTWQRFVGPMAKDRPPIKLS